MDNPFIKTLNKLKFSAKKRVIMFTFYTFDVLRSLIRCSAYLLLGPGLE